MHSRNVCVFFSLSVYYDVVVGAVVMATARDAAAAAVYLWLLCSAASSSLFCSLR